jgi:hypothetical protein
VTKSVEDACRSADVRQEILPHRGNLREIGEKEMTEGIWGFYRRLQLAVGTRVLRRRRDRMEDSGAVREEESSARVWG